MPKSRQFFSRRSICVAAILVDDRQALGSGRRRMVGGRDREIRTADFQAARSQSVKCLRRRDFVDQMQVDVEQRGCGFELGDNVVVPDLFDDGSRMFCGTAHIMYVTLSPPLWAVL